MFGITAKTRITIGLTLLLLSIMMGANFLGVIPDRRSAVLEGRRKLCEAIAINSSILVGQQRQRELEAVLRATVGRNDDLESAAVRGIDGQLIIEVGNHAGHWTDVAEGRSIDTQLQVPLRKGEQKWGSVELRFAPTTRAGLAGVFQDPMTRLIAFVGSCGFIFFLLYLRKMLANLDPSKAVPKRVRSALDSLAEGLLVTDTEERILLANQAFSDWFGESPDRLTGRIVSKLPWVTKFDSPEEYPWNRAIRERTQVAGEFMELADKNGQQRTLIVNASPVVGQGGQYRGVIISLDDVTQLEETKRELKVAKQMAENASQAKSDFLARMSHEIRTPMNAILGFSDVLRRGFEGDEHERQEHLNTIHSSGQHLLNLINDILDLSKVEAGKLEIERKRCSPYEVIYEVVKVLRVKADEKGISLNVNPRGQLPETIMTDAVRLRQIVTNLVGNAIKFTDHGGVRIDIHLGHNSKLHIDIADSGIGMQPDTLERIFEPFSQADTSITRRFGGTGLGLSISKRFSEVLGGDIVVESVAGRGSTFKVTIDTGSLDGVKLVDGALLVSQVAESQEDKSDDYWLSSCRVLVADDSVANRKLLNLYLSRAGARVTQAEDGEVAVQMATSREFDVILMDMQMPVMDGFTATARLREMGMTTPIIALTADAMKGVEMRCREAGCNGFLTKPIEMDRLIEAIVELLPIEGDDSGQLEPNDLLEARSEPQGLGLDYDEIRGEFTQLLVRQLEELHTAVEAHDFDQVEQIAHSIRGAGATFGFNALVGPALEVELLTQQGDAKSLSDAARELIEIAEPIIRTSATGDSRFTAVNSARCENKHDTDALPDASPSNEAIADNPDPIESNLPTGDPEFAEIVVEFVEHLNEKLEEMQSAWQSGDLDQLAKLAHWLKGAGGMTGFDAFTAPARQLESLAKAQQTDQISEAIQKLRSITDRIVLPAVS